MAAESPLRKSRAGADEPVTGANNPEGTLDAWPRDEQGQPMIQVTAGAREIIGLRDHSNVMVGPSSITLFVAQGQNKIFPDEDVQALANSINQLHEMLEVDVIAEQRGIVLGTVDPSKRHD